MLNITRYFFILLHIRANLAKFHILCHILYCTSKVVKIKQRMGKLSTPNIAKR